MLAPWVLLIALGGLPETAPTSGAANIAAQLHPIERDIVAWTNAQRTHFGLAPLAIDPALVDSARRHAAWMTNSRSLVHTGMAVGENIAMGQPTTSQVMAEWMNSSGHRANILNSSYTRIGVAAYSAPDGTVYWCQQFLQ